MATCLLPRGRSMPDVVIVDSGVANLASITSGFARLGASVAVTRAPTVVRQAPRVVLRGVGACGGGMGALRAGGLDGAMRDVAASGTPLLGVCLGMQLVCEASEETPGVRGLGVIGGACRRLPGDVRVPHLGWNTVTAAPSGGLVATGVAAFANSYALRDAPPGWTAAWTTHGIRFVAALEQEGDRVVACQFHPELSGAYGAALLGRWLTGAKVVPTPAAAAAPGLLPRVVPCLDVKDGRVVKGVRFQDLRDAGDPATLAAAYESQGADEIVVLDVAASAEARATQLDTVARVRASIRIPLTVGGGVRRVDDARRFLAAGADKVSVNTAAIARPALLSELAAEFGSQCVVLAIDARHPGAAMIVPSIDVINGRAVQLRRGREFVLDGGDPLARLEQFAVAGEVAVVDLDAALGRGSNADLIREMVRRAPCRVGGGIRDLDAARAWLDSGAAKIMIGTAASPELCAALPRERVIAAVDTDRGQVVVDGWRRDTGVPVVERIRALAPVVGGFLFTQVEREGAMDGFDFQAVAEAVRAAGESRLTAAGGIPTPGEIARLDPIGADAQVGMAVYTGRVPPGGAGASSLAKPIDNSGRGVWPTVVCDEWGRALGLVWSTAESLARAVEERRGVYWSRSRQALWVKRETSGNTQLLLRVDLDCDRDALRFSVRQHGAGFF